jgi:hypothetical protein
MKMKISQSERETLRGLAKRYAELAALPVQAERVKRACDINDLIPRRPMVWLYEIPWHEMDIDGKLTLTCEDEYARKMEWFFRTMLYRWEYIQADTVLENEFPIPRAYTSTGNGLNIKEDTIATDERNNIISHTYKDQLDTLEKVMALKEPVLTAHPETDKARLEFASDILDGILPARLRGYYIYHAPWDRIPRHRGVTQTMIDLHDEPELMHAIIKKYTENGLSEMKQMEKLQLLDDGPVDVHCTPAYVSGLAPDKPPATLKNTWFRAMAQMFGDVSPEMWEEYELNYVKPLMAECGLVYYGCCEALDRKIPKLKTIPNLRKIGVSPWANPEVCAEQIRGDYVYANKPNPAHVAGSFKAEAVRAETKRVIETCMKNGCSYEFVLKDISTVTYKPGNLIEWVKTVEGVIDEYY